MNFFYVKKKSFTVKAVQHTYTNGVFFWGGGEGQGFWSFLAWLRCVFVHKTSSQTYTVLVDVYLHVLILVECGFDVCQSPEVLALAGVQRSMTEKEKDER